MLHLSLHLPHICSMRVLFDHQVFSWQAYGGISRYIFEIRKGIQQLGHEALLPEHFYSDNVYLRTLPELVARPIIKQDFKGKKWLQERLGRRSSLNTLIKTKPDVFHPTYFGDYFLKTALKSRTPFVITIHDMIHEKYAHRGSGFFSLDAHVIKNKRLLAQHAHAIVVVSENTRRDLLAYMPELNPAKIHTIYHGNSMRPSEITQTMELPKRYLLFVGQRGAYKNFSWMLEQLADLLRTDTSLFLVCVGGGAFDSTERAQIKQLGIEGKLLRPEIQSDLELAELYSRAQCFIFPSQYEGFGIPVLEAFACGCPVVLNNVSSLPEVGGDAVLYFQETIENSLSKSVEMLLHDAELRNGLVQRGHERVKQFSWQKSAAAHLSLYKSIAASK